MKVNLSKFALWSPFRSLLRTRFAPRWLVLGLDLVWASCALFVAALLRFDFRVPGHEWEVLAKFLPWFWSIRAALFVATRSHAGIIRHTGSRDAMRIFWSVTAGSIAFIGANFIAALLTPSGKYLAPFSILAIEWLGSVVGLIAFRLIVKWIYINSRRSNGEMLQVAIYGAGEAGMMAKRALDRDLATAGMRVLAFIDDDKGKVGKKLEGTDILSAAEARQLFQSGRVDRLILAIRNLPEARRKAMVDLALKHGVRPLHVPPIENWIGGELSAGQIRELKIEDLLGRAPIQLGAEPVKRLIGGKRVAVTGAAGSIGSECVRQILMHHPASLLAVDQAETPMHDLWVDLNKLGVGDIIDLQVGDIRDAQQVRDTFEAFRPDIVIHAAAYKHVNMMEGQPWQAFETNVVGTLNVIEAAMACGAERFIQVSTDKAVNPTSVMGATKRLAELLVISQVGRSKTQLITTRFGNVLGSNGSVIPLFRAQIAAGGPVTVTDAEITRYFMTIPEAVSLILQAGAMGQGGDVFLFDMGEAVKILDLAYKMIRLSGLEPEKDIEVKITGMRPGEKLHEELRLDQEDLLSTPHEKIMRVAHRAEIPGNLLEAIQAVASKRADHSAALELLQGCLPEYHPKMKGRV